MNNTVATTPAPCQPSGPLGIAMEAQEAPTGALFHNFVNLLASWRPACQADVPDNQEYIGAEADSIIIANDKPFLTFFSNKRVPRPASHTHPVPKQSVEQDYSTTLSVAATLRATCPQPYRKDVFV